MSKLDLNSLRQRAIQADEARKTEAAFRRSLLERIHSTVFECSVDGIVALTTLAHMSIVAEGLPEEISLGVMEAFKGTNARCRRESNGAWVARISEPRGTDHLSPAQMLEAIAAAASVPLDKDARAAIYAVVNPLRERDFDHLANVLDLLPLHTLWAMMANGPVLSRAFGVGPAKTEGKGQDHMLVGSFLPRGPRKLVSLITHHPDIGRFARCVADAIMRRGGKIEEPGSHIRNLIDDSIIATGGVVRPGDIRIPAPACVEMFDPWVPAEAIEDFLKEAVRIGYDINMIAASRGAHPTSAAHEAVRLMDVKGLDRLVALGLDLQLADNLDSLTTVALNRLRRPDGSKQGFAMLKHLVKKGCAVDAMDYEILDDAVTACKVDIRNSYGDEGAEARRRLEFLVTVIDFVEERFPHLRKPPKTRRRAA
jgi:hypothetical protein